MKLWAAGTAEPRRVIFWRHGRTEWNARGLFQGQEDISLDDLGRQQAREAAVELAHVSPALILSSDLARSADTGRELASLTGLPLELDERFRETYAGRWQGLSFGEIAARFPKDHAAWRGGDPDVRAGGGESRLDVGQRMSKATLDAVASLESGQTLVVASHGGAIRAGLAALMGLPPGLWASLSGVSNCHWSVLEEHDHGPGGCLAWQLTEHNVGLASMPSTPLEG